MSNYSSLKATIDANVKANNNQEITGAILNSVLNAVVNSMGAKYQYAGVATPDTDPGTPDQNLFYIATTPGTYTNFGGIVVASGECVVLKGTGSTWSKEDTGIDLVSVSQNILTIGGTKQSSIGVVTNFFVGNGTTWADSTTKVVAGRTYRLIFENNNWDLPTLSAEYSIFEIYYKKNGNEINIFNIDYSSSVEKEYKIEIPDDFINGDGLLYVGGRATAGTNVWYSLIDETELDKVKSNISNNSADIGKLNSLIATIHFVGDNTNYVQTSTKTIVAGRKYRFLPHITEWEIPSTVPVGNTFFELYYKKNNTDIQVYTRDYGQTMLPYYDVEIPSDFVNADNGILYIGGRATKDVEVYFNIIDITEIDGIIPIVGQLNDKVNNNSLAIQSNRPYKNSYQSQEGKVVSLLWFSDIHQDDDNIAKIKAKSLDIAAYIDDVIHTGDTAGAVYSEYGANMWERCGVGAFLNVIGNHDVYISNDGQLPHLSKTETYNAYFKRWISQWNVQQPAGAETDGLSYYYKDYQSYLRLIVLDCMHYDTDQDNWLASTLADALTNNLVVVIAVHSAPSCDTDVDTHFTSLDYPNIGENIPTGAESTVSTFINNGGDFVCWISGDNHWDAMGHTASGQLVLRIECAVCDATWVDAARVRGTQTENCYNLISFESETNCVKLVRFGNEYDHYLRHKGCLCYNWKTKTKITEF